MKIVIFGDSITNGYDHVDHSSSLLLKEAVEKVAQHEVEVILQGVNGENTADALKRVGKVLAEQADKVLVFFGANDAANHVPVTPEQFHANLTRIVQQIGTDKAVLLTPPYHNDDCGVDKRSNRFVERFGAETKAVAEQFNLPLIDIYQAMRASEQANAWLQADGFHISTFGYEQLGQVIVKALGL